MDVEENIQAISSAISGICVQALFTSDTARAGEDAAFVADLSVGTWPVATFERTTSHTAPKQHKRSSAVARLRRLRQTAPSLTRPPLTRRHSLSHGIAAASPAPLAASFSYPAGARTGLLTPELATGNDIKGIDVSLSG